MPRNTTKLRKKIYQEALKFIKERVEDNKIQKGYPIYYNGICLAISRACEILNIDTWDAKSKVFSFYEDENVYIELDKYCPKRKRDKNLNWFPHNIFYTKKRIAILEEIISTM
jgi:hypothetical protein